MVMNWLAVTGIKRIPKSVKRFSDKMRVKIKKQERRSDKIRSKSALELDCLKENKPPMLWFGIRR